MAQLRTEDAGVFKPQPFEVGDTLAIGLPGGGYGLVVIGRLNLERMFCTSFGPRFTAFPDAAALSAWKPDGWSSWMADTLGLRDGSWVKVKEPPAMAETRHIDTRVLPPFKFTVAKTGELNVAVYDPETLYVQRIIEKVDPEKYKGAPSFMPQDATTFEVALSRNMGSPCELPDQAKLKILNEERLVVAMLRERMSDISLELIFDHVLAFKRKREAEQARISPLEDGVNVSDPIKPGWFTRTVLEVHVRSKAEYPLVKSDVQRMRDIARRYRAEYDGFGAAAL